MILVGHAVVMILVDSYVFMVDEYHQDIGLGVKP